MKIALISFDNWGLNEGIAKVLKQDGHTVHHIDFHNFIYKYPSFYYKIYNAFLKVFFRKNIKNIYYGKEIIKHLEQIGERQDLIVTIKGDFIDKRYLKQLKNYTRKSIGFFNDSATRCPKIKRVASAFDQAFSFEKEDCQKLGLKFAPNWIYEENKNSSKGPFDFQVFNICSKDKRLPVLSKIISELKSKQIKHKIIVLSRDKECPKSEIEFFFEKITLEEISKFIEKSNALLDIKRDGQFGLTFRIFESMGLEKKLITTNPDIVNYDFYNPNNILVIDEKNPVIPTSFFESDYEKLPEEIYHKYTIRGWIQNVLFHK
ncbi:hypothetical protein [Flavobacterium lindanitolerans]|uniref:hypothetical protein n=1 Tax=Flavobacterium lindanitolerans TaxID=428988 RepID=UPI0031AE3ED4